MGHQTGNLNGLNLGRQSRGYGDNYAHVGATENDYQYGVSNGHGYDGYGHSDIHHWGSQSGWGSDGWGDSKAWGRKGDHNGLGGLKGLKGFDGLGARGVFGRKGRDSFATLYDAGPDEYRGNEGDYIQGRHDVDDPSRFSHHYDGDRDSGEKDDRVVDDRFDPEDAELQYPNRGNRFITNPDNGINAPRFHANADNQGVGRNIGAGRGTFGQGYGFSNYSHTHDDSNAGFAATKFGGRNDANRGQGDHAKKSYHRRSYW